MKNFRDYLSESEEAADNPVVGDNFAINIREECLIESVVVESRDDGVVIAADERMMQLLESYGYSFEQTCMECGGSGCGCGQSADEYGDETDVGQDPGEYDQEGDMAKDELMTMIRSARKLIGMLDNNDNMPEWTQKKINKATDYVDTASDYISSKKERGVMERSARDPGKLDLSSNPTKSQVWARYMWIYDYEGYQGEENSQEMQDLEDYAARRFGQDMVNDMISAGYDSYFGRRSDPKKPIDQGTGNYTSLARNAISAADVKKDGKLTKRANANTKQRVADRLGKHPEPNLPESSEEKESNPVVRATLHRIMMRHPGMLAQHGPERVMQAVDDVADLVGDMDDIGSSDISGWVNMVREILDSLDQGVAEGSLNEAATMASVSKLLRHIERHHPSWFDDYGMGEVEDTVVDMAEQGTFSGMTVVDAAALVGQELESMYGADAMNEAEQLHPETLELIDEYIAKIEPDADRDEMIQSVIRGSIHPSELEYALKDDVAEAEYQGRKVQLGKKMKGDVKKSKVYVKNPQGNVVKVNFGDPNMKIRKSNPGARKSFRARHNCDNPGPRHKARYWSCRSW